MSENHNKSGFIPYIFVIFFAVVFIVNFTYIYIAQKTWRGISTSDSYTKGLQYNKTIEYVKQQKNLGWHFKVKFVNEGNKLGSLKVCLLNKNQKFITDAKLLVKISRPTQEGYDFEQNLLPKNDCYFSKIKFPLKGQWDVEIQAFSGDIIFQEVKRYVVQ